jgi:uncharacterized protein YbbK (DUF523 family)/uncharacterized protein YbgA (DUF1722 family)
LEKANPVKVLISACLLGERVRYDGQHKREPFLVDQVGKFVQWVRICPEVDSGMPTPRPAMHLVGDPAAPRLVSTKGEDLTESMLSFCRKRVEQLQEEGLCGYICKKNSPSSGMERVKVYPDYQSHNDSSRTGAGLFTGYFRKFFPFLPVEEEGRLHDPILDEWFWERVFCMHRWRNCLEEIKCSQNLLSFHQHHYYLLRTHSEKASEQLGRWLTSSVREHVETLYKEYEKQFFAILGHPVAKMNRIQVLIEIAQSLKDFVPPDEMQEMLGSIYDYDQSIVPLVVPMVLLKHHVRRQRISLWQRQTFFEPFPEQLGLWNRV